MVDVLKNPQELGTQPTPLPRRRRVASILILIVEVGFVAWGAMAALAPERLLGPDSVPILTAGYEGFTKSSWSELAGASPKTAEFMTVLFRVYGAYNMAFGLLATAITATAFRGGDGWAWWVLLVGNTIALGSAMTYDWTVNAIGPFELSEYLGLALMYGALAATAPFLERNARVDRWAEHVPPESAGKGTANGTASRCSFDRSRHMAGRRNH